MHDLKKATTVNEFKCFDNFFPIFEYLHNLLYLWGSYSKCKPETELNQINLLLQLFYSTGR